MQGKRFSHKGSLPLSTPTLREDKKRKFRKMKLQKNKHAGEGIRTLAPTKGLPPQGSAFDQALPPLHETIKESTDLKRFAENIILQHAEVLPATVILQQYEALPAPPQSLCPELNCTLVKENWHRFLSMRHLTCCMLYDEKSARGTAGWECSTRGRALRRSARPA